MFGADAATLITSNASYILLAFAPPVLWLLFYLREDKHPEPKALLLLAFVGGMASAVLALFGECVWVALVAGSCHSINFGVSPILLFLGIALVEEYAKFLPIRYLIMKRPEFDEPVDAMIYMMTAALGFAALENALFAFQFFYRVQESTLLLAPLTHETVLASVDVATNRFLGANLLHALSSGIVGYFLARAFFSPRRHYFVGLGIIVAALLHAGFNYLILEREALAQGTFYIILLLSTMAVMVLVDFERLKQNKTNTIISNT